MTEAGRAMEIAELTVRLHERHHPSDPDLWRELVSRAGDLSQQAAGLILGRATAITGEDEDAEAFFRRAGAEIASLRVQRESLLADVTAAIASAAP